MAARDPLSFTANSSLLNAKFESYKLRATCDSDASQVHRLPRSGFRTPTLPDHCPLSLAQAQSRARHNHLAVGHDGELVYVDAEGFVTAIDLSQACEPQYHTLLQLLPSPASSPSPAPHVVAEYPSAWSLAPRHWLIADGRGTYFDIEITKQSGAWYAELQTTHKAPFATTADSLRAVQTHAASLLPDGDTILLFSEISKGQTTSSTVARVSGGPLASTARPKLESSTTFRYTCVQLSTSARSNSQAAMSPRALWRIRSDALPHFAHFSQGRFALGASSPFFTETSSAPQSFPTPVEEAVTDVSQRAPSAGRTQLVSPSASKPPPFSWTQDSDSLTVVFAVPSDLPTSSIRLTFSRQFLTLQIGSAAASLASGRSPSPLLPHVSHKRLWDSIDPHTSVWTFDREAEGRDSTYGLLSLHLEKSKPGLKWPDVFALTPRASSVLTDSQASTAAADDDQRHLENVDETLDPSELATISEKMEQWTKDDNDNDSDDAGATRGVPTSLSGQEIDVEVDADMGLPLVVTWIETATTPQPALVCPHPSVPFPLISTPLPSAIARSGLTVTIKHDVDGLLFGMPSSNAPTYAWDHLSTFPAIAFVLATKRDARFVHHLGQRAVLAFDSPSASALASSKSTGFSGAGNLFVYFAPEDGKSTVAAQMVARIGGPSSGNLVGVAECIDGRGRSLVAALCENELVVFDLFE